MPEAVEHPEDKILHPGRNISPRAAEIIIMVSASAYRFIVSRQIAGIIFFAVLAEAKNARDQGLLISFLETW
jgi:hypothetical protein